MTGHVVWLDETDSQKVEITGGKGSSLGRMWKAGMPVPPGFVVAAAALRDSLVTRGVVDEVEELVSAFSASGEASVAARIQKMVTSAPLRGELAEEITKAYRRLGEGAFVAVRSSACAEDGEAASFAGQQETFLNVVGSGGVLSRIVDCWASFFSERAMFYRRAKGSLNDLAMAVVVQTQIASEKSGVMFTIDPIRRRSDQMVIEAAYGLGEAVVSGMVTPDNYVVRRDGRLKRARVGRQEVMIVRSADGGTEVMQLDPETADAQILTADDLHRLVTTGVQLEEAFGAPQDVEWAFHDDRLYVLQSRPITA